MNDNFDKKIQKMGRSGYPIKLYPSGAGYSNHYYNNIWHYRLVISVFSKDV